MAAKGMVKAAMAVLPVLMLITAPATYASRQDGTRGSDDAGDVGRGDLTKELQDATFGAARFVSRKDGPTTFIGSSSAVPLQPSAGDDMSGAGRQFVDRYGALFGVDVERSGLTELRASEGEPGTGGAVRYQQTYEGLPVIAGEVAVQIDANGSVVSASGEASPHLDVDPVANTSADTATSSAIGVTARMDAADISELTASAPVLSIYDPALIGADVEDDRGPRLVWHVEVRTMIGDVNRFVLMDADTGVVALQFNQRKDGLVRQICDNANSRSLSQTCTAPARTEGGAANAVADVNSAYDQTKVTYDFYKNNFNRDSVDGSGLTLKSTVRYCTDSLATACPYANAFWNGAQMVYGAGYATADDIVGHELTHGVTQYTSGLFYYADAGAINESISDVMGELIDLGSTVSGADPAADRWRLAEQLPGGPIRDMKNPPTFGDPDKMSSTLFAVGVNDSRGVHTNSGVNNKAAYLMTDGATFNGQTVLGIGASKVAAIYYQAETTLLTPGSDYLDLAVILPQACMNLIGTMVPAMTTADCEQVQKAVLATEMNQRASKAGATLTAPLCDSGVQSAIQFADDMEADRGSWAATRTGNGGQWQYSTDSSQSRTTSLHVVDKAGPRGISTLTGRFTTAIPAGVTYLRFDHSFDTDYSESPLRTYDGGVVEFTTNAGATWSDIASLPGSVVNGYNTTLDNSSSGSPALPNELQGRMAFGITSPNYETTRVDFSSLAGQSVQIRFRFATDNYASGEFPGWFIDDVSFYSCGAVQPPGSVGTVVASPGTRSAGLTWSAPLGDGGSPITVYSITPYVNGVAQPSVDTPTAATSFVVPGLTGGVRYTFRLAANNVAGAGSQSPDSNGVVPVSVPSQPNAVTASSSERVVTVNWSPPSTDGGATITGYRVTAAIDGIAQAPISTGMQNALVLTDARAGSAYTFTVAATNALGTGPASSPSPPVTPSAVVAPPVVVPPVVVPPAVVPRVEFAPLVPARLLDSRTERATVDGQFNGICLRAPSSVTAITVAGRGGVDSDAAAVVLNVTVTEAQAPGYLTVYPCGGDPPTASNLNYLAGFTVPNLVAVKVGTNGQICLFTQSAVHLLADVAGYFPSGSSLTSLVPARLLDSRPDRATIDGQANGIGQRSPGSVTEVQVAGRAGVPADAAAAVLNVTVSEPEADGYVTVYPCGAEPPTASNVNYTTGATVPNAAVTKIGSGGRVCVFTQSATQVIVDVNGYFPAGSALVPLSPARVLDSRAHGATVDGQSQGIGPRPAASVTEVQVIGRAGVTAAAAAVVLNVTVTESQAPGYATVYPCGAQPPTASNLNYGTGSTTANAVVTKVGVGGKVCIFTQQPTHLLADVTASFSG